MKRSELTLGLDFINHIKDNYLKDKCENVLYN